MAEEKILTENELDGVSGGMKITVANVPPRKDGIYVETANASNKTLGSTYTATVTTLSDKTLGSVTAGNSTGTITEVMNV